MKTFHVISTDNGWRVEGASKGYTYKTKEAAVVEAMKVAKTENVPVVVHSKDGRVVSVSANSPKVLGRRVFSANVKKSLNAKRVRNTIAEVIYASSHKK